jgi:hypothetical protein
MTPPPTARRQKALQVLAGSDQQPLAIDALKLSPPEAA